MNSCLLVLHFAFAGWHLLAVILVFISGVAVAQSQDKLTVFQPVQPQKEINAERTSNKLTIDGKLNEEDWSKSPSPHVFYQVQPYQGNDSILHTHIKVLYDNHYLYVGAFCHDSLGRRGTRVPDLRRDFADGSCDLFEVTFDPFKDKRNAMSFMTNPHSAQRDELAFDDQLFDADWDALWRVRTHRSDSGWTAEMAIPWKTLRYPKGSTEWGIQFFRVARRLNQRTAWSPFPRAFSSTRMDYAGILKNIEPPPPSANVRLNP
ncbi:MAG TPA: carbohydrate binding family 9 domain-containing protein, partial [Cyclobacteriaceae bacterium]|nr:carbohydrate binding family 9 domain-containing protein [Cyclobacteriaceae bacterium]